MRTEEARTEDSDNTHEKCMSTTIPGNGAVQFTFFFIMRLNITIITSCDSLIVILVT